MRSRLALIFIHLFVLWQVKLGLGYYLSGGDRFDERFAWRMFSAERMAECNPLFRVGEAARPVALGKTFHEAWVSIARRGRRDVLEAMAARLCRDNPGQPVKLEMRCQKVGGPSTLVSAGSWDLCRTGGL